MKKTCKRLGAIFLAMAMAVSVLCTGAMAAETNSITINNTTTGYAYEAYQVFAGTLSTNSENKTILGITGWGSGVDASKLVSALRSTKDTNLKDKFSDILKKNDSDSTDTYTATDAVVAQNVASIVAGFKDNSDEAKAFAKIVGQNLSDAKTNFTENKNDDQTTGYSATGLAAGYYLVKNTKVPEGAAAYSSNILEVVGNVMVDTKTSVPTVVKKIVKNDTETDAITSNVGDMVNFRLTATLPDKYNDYQQYKLVFHDTLSEGLTYDMDSVKVYQQLNNGNKTEINSDNYSVTTTGTADNCSLEVSFTNLKNVVANREVADTIIVEYTATLNEKASLDNTTGNTNKVKLEYSNDPNHTGENDPTGNTPESEVKVYTTGLKLTKVDGNTKATLTGAKFKISGTASKVIIVNSTVYNKDTKGTYYLLKNGTYTTTAPTENDIDKYDSATQKYVKIDTVTKDTVPTTFETEAYVDNNGVLKITGLGEGTYTITELKAPDGYNLLQEPITITITANATKDSCTWIVKNGNTDLTLDNTDTTLYAFNVVNNAGSQLPSTGGMGTTLFYVIGGALMAGAAIVLVIKKKRSSAE